MSVETVTYTSSNNKTGKCLKQTNYKNAINYNFGQLAKSVYMMKTIN